MQNDFVKNQNEIYKKNFIKHGDSPQGTYNQNQEIQYLRFERILKQFTLTQDTTIHDIGCGICDLYQYMKEKNIPGVYSGTEIVEEMVTLAHTKYPDIQISVRDITSQKNRRKV